MKGKLKKNCGCATRSKRSAKSCSCSPVVGHKITANLDQDGEAWRVEQFDGRETLIVPLVMARADVVMNGGYLPPEEFAVPAWDGQPVTVGHPATADGFVGASSSPQTHENWVVGKLFHVRQDGLKLKAEAYVDIEKAEQVMPGVVASLKDPEARMNVSTGFFSTDVPEKGTMGGRAFGVKNTQIRPNHLALLPFEEGACSWEDGCGVRANKEIDNMAGKNARSRRGAAGKVGLKVNEKVSEALKTLGSALGVTSNEALKAYVAEDEASRKQLFSSLGRLFANERGEDDDRRQVIADLISNDESPFLPDDEDSLRMMSDATLHKMRDEYIAAMEGEEGEEDPAPVANEGEDDGEEPAANADEGEGDEPAANRRKTNTRRRMKPIVNAHKNPTISSKELQRLVSNAASDAASAAVSKVLTPDVLVALKSVENSAKESRAKLVDHIVTNSAMERKLVETWPLATLEHVAAGIHVNASFAGRVVTNGGDVDEKLKDLAPPSSFVANKRLQRTN